MVYVLMGILTFLFVFCKAFQQRNVIHNNWKLIPVFTVCMAFLEMTIPALGIQDIINNGWDSLIYITICNGIGGTIGCWTAMTLHNKVLNKEGMYN